MSVTINDVELKKVDLLTPDQLMIGDLIFANDEVVEVLEIESDATGTIYAIEYMNEFGEQDVAEFNFDEKISFYVYVEEE